MSVTSITNQEVAVLRNIQDKIYEQNVQVGWRKPKLDPTYQPDFSKGLVLIHAELSEAVEGFRKELMDDKLPHRPMVEVELADAIIRILDLAAAFGWDVAGALQEKHDFNAVREDHKLENRAKPGGKKF